MCQSKGGRRPRSDDVDAVMRLLVLDNTYYRDLLCEFGAMFAIANRIDTVHKLPWIGFQSWRAAGKKVQSLIDFPRSCVTFGHISFVNLLRNLYSSRKKRSSDCAITLF